jgi:YHS domain-containing protein
MFAASQSNAIVVMDGDPFHPKREHSTPLTLALYGYCPVSLRDQQKWVLGSREIQAIRDDKVYLFANARARDIFIAAPEIYLPVLDGDCPVSFSESKTRRAGQLAFGILHQRRLFFFASERKLHSFEAEPVAYTSIDLIDNGNCVVSKVEEHRVVAGLPETVVVVDGMRYFFASAFHRRLFLLNPQRYGVNKSYAAQSFTKIVIPNNEYGEDLSTLTFGDRSPRNDSVSKTLINRKNNKADDEGELAEKIENRAMGGYCPVSIHTTGIWQRGKSKYQSMFDGKVYFMIGTEELAAFQENPQRYVPVLSGDSIITYMNDFERVPGSIFHAVLYNERLYLLANAKEKVAFREQAEVFENVDLAYHGNCTVTMVENQREVEGFAEFETLFHGKRYRFVSQVNKEKFLLNPKHFEEK